MKRDDPLGKALERLNALERRVDRLTILALERRVECLTILDRLTILEQERQP